MNKLRNRKLGVMTLVGLWMLMGCSGAPYVENHGLNEQNEAANLPNADDGNPPEAGNLLAGGTPETENPTAQTTDDIRGSVMEIADNRIEIREQISIIAEEYELVADAPEEDGWLTITFTDATIFEIIEFNAGGILNRSEGTPADIYLDDAIHAFGQQLEDELAAEKIEIWVLIH